MVRLEDIPSDDNGDVLRQMRLNGDSLIPPRPIDFSVAFPNQCAALAFCDTFAESGFKLACNENPDGENLPWEVTVTRDMVPDHVEIRVMEDWLAGKAEALGGENVGWGCFNMADLPGN